jgi:hypothetical protein
MSAGHVCRACLPGRSAGHVCRACLPGMSAGQVGEQATFHILYDADVIIYVLHHALFGKKQSGRNV